MSRFVAGFALLYVCAVSGQQDRYIHRGSAFSDKTSIAIDSISGGRYPAGAFSIGHGGETFGANGRPGASYGVKRLHYGDYGNGQDGIIKDDFGHSDVGNNGYDQTGYRRISPTSAPVHDYNDRPNDYNDYGQHTKYPPIANSGTRNRFYTSLVRYLLSWF